MTNLWPPVPASGQLVSNRYKILNSIGIGTFGEVFLAEDTKFDPPRSVAIKFLHSNFLNDHQELEDLKREAGVLARFNHPNILRVIDFEITPRLAYIVTDYAEGGSLSEKIYPDPDKPQIRLSPKEVAKYLEPLCDALDEAHSLGLIHRDIKPLNILLDKRGRPLLADFGLAAALSGSQASSQLMDLNASGTPAYMAPEQWLGQVGKASDIYALGILTFQLLTGKLPYMGNQLELMGQHLNAPIPKLKDRAPDLQYPVTLDKVIEDIIAKDPKQRTRSALAFFNRYNLAISPPVSNGQGQPPPINPPILPPKTTIADPAYAKTEVAYRPPAPRSTQLNSYIQWQQEALKTSNKKKTIPGIPLWWVLGLFIAAILVGPALYNTFTTQQASSQSVNSANITSSVSQPTFPDVPPPNTPTLPPNTPNINIQATINAQVQSTIGAQATATARMLPTITFQEAQKEIANLNSRARLIYGPVSGQISNANGTEIAAQGARVDVQNFYVTARFYNPYSITEGKWSYGFLFRNTNYNEQYRIVLDSSGSWALYLAQGTVPDKSIQSGVFSGVNWDTLEKGSSVNFNTAPDGFNDIVVHAYNGSGYLYVNNQFVANLNLSGKIAKGDVSIATNMYKNYNIPGRFTRFENFSVAELS